MLPSLLCVLFPHPHLLLVLFHTPRDSSTQLSREAPRTRCCTTGQLTDPGSPWEAVPSLQLLISPQGRRKPAKKRHFSGPCPKPEAGPSGWCWSFIPPQAKGTKRGWWHHHTISFWDVYCGQNKKPNLKSCQKVTSPPLLSWEMF